MRSLGAAVALMDAMMLRLNLPTQVQMTTTVFGLPRSGNQEWADFVDKTVRTGYDPLLLFHFHHLSEFC